MANNHNLVRIITVLLERQGEVLNIMKIAKYARIDYKNAYNYVKKLEELGIVEITKVGRTKKIELVKALNPLIFESEFRRREFLLKKRKDIKVIHKILSDLKFPFICLLFGSVAKGQATEHSDIDLLFVCEKGREKIIREKVESLPLDIHPTFVNFEEFVAMAKTKEFTVVSEAMKKNIILVGIEDYYRLIEDVD